MDYQNFEQMIMDFTYQRNWDQYHNLKDLALSLNLEASEVSEVFQWKDEKQPLTNRETNDLEMELADVFIYLAYMCEKLHVTPLELAGKKMTINQGRTWKLDNNE
ncbi:nucleotide pyrophosphohydrolase [Levilactobacillus bambusae]|uniref:Nucleotide pyrophosphohydrolase n=1 Tax=Levilactobacillus bambusae TaxID=2024736 RepID=A0A2V1N168_9LACO|nr:nucleotide pyrophosphohydrolase [Levilactobacillus bambusae]PWG00488.1 nucleotide pyrophosphohydrolase [Levilactobacillus bambusae]